MRQDGIADQLLLLERPDDVAVVGRLEPRACATFGARRCISPWIWAKASCASFASGSGASPTPTCSSWNAYRSAGRRKSVRAFGRISVRTNCSYAASCSRTFAKGSRQPSGLYLFEELFHPGDQHGAVGQVAFDLRACRRKQLRVAKMRPGQFGRLDRDWFDVPGHPGVLSQAFDRRGPPFWLDLRIEQRPDAAVYEGGDVGIGEQPVLVQLLAAHLVLRRVHQDVEILPHQGILLGSEQRLQLRERGRARLSQLLERLRSQARDLAIEAGHSDLARAFRAEPRQDVQQHLRVLVAGFDPGARVCGRLAGTSEHAISGRRQKGDKKQQGNHDEAFHARLFHHDSVRMAASPV